jgi:protoheme IX farnesyltransferase
MFALIFIWTPPHFWALAVRYREDYAAAEVPMLPVVASMRRTTRDILVYTLALVLVSLMLAVVGHLGLLYGTTAAVLGAVFLWKAIQLRYLASRDSVTNKAAMRLFGFSITYLTLLFVAMAASVLVQTYLLLPR